MTKSRVYRASRPTRSGTSTYHFAQPFGQEAGGHGPLSSPDDRPHSLPVRPHRESPEGRHYDGTLAAFLSSLSPGIEVVVQYDCQPASYGIYQGLRDGTVLLTNYNGYPGLVRLAIERLNAISVF